MAMTKGNEPTSKAGGFKAHNPASPNNEPTTSRKPGTDFGGNAAKHLSNPSGMKGNKFTASNDPT